MLLPDRPHDPRHLAVHLGQCQIPAGSVTSRISVHRSAPEFMPSMVRSRKYAVASRTVGHGRPDLVGATEHVVTVEQRFRRSAMTLSSE